MTNKKDGIFIDLTSSVTVDQALRSLLNISASSISESSILEKKVKLEDVDTLENILSCILEDAETDNSNVKFKELYPETTPELESLNKAKLLIFNASRYKNDIVDELAKQNKSKLKIDINASKNAKLLHITKSSLNSWALKKYGINLLKAFSTLPVTEQTDKPWLMQHPKDPIPDQAWYIPGRYFARQIVIRDPSLTEKMNLLVEKISIELINVGIYKRGGQKPHNTETIKKALIKIKLK